MENGYSMCFNEWALDKEIKDELGLLLIISSLCAEKGYCWANNKYFSELFNISEVSVSRKIKKLEIKNYIKIEYEKRGCEITKRIIRLTKMLTDDYQKCKSTINKNVKDNNININNTNNNKINNIVLNEIIDYLNDKTGKHFKYTDTNKKHIKARLNEGFTVEDIKTVIDKKVKEWLNNDKMNKYLRPETLFGTKFESYFNEKEKELTTKDIANYIDWSDF